MSCDASSISTEDMQGQFFIDIQGSVLAKKFRVFGMIGQGSSARVFEGVTVKTNERVAIKFETARYWPSPLATEDDVYKVLVGHDGFPKKYWSGEMETSKGDSMRTMVLERLGPSLADLVLYCGRTFSLKTTLMIGHQLLERLETLHRLGYIHRDIKPSNLAVGADGEDINTIYMIDFGLVCRHDAKIRARPVKSKPETAEERITRIGAADPRMAGNAPFASLNQHYYVDHFPRDDLEGLGYLLIYFMRGHLPWDGIKGHDQDSVRRRIGRAKLATGVDELCGDLPDAFKLYMTYVFGIQGAIWPDYAYLRGLLKKLFFERGFMDDMVYDWTLLEFVRLRGIDQLPERICDFKKSGSKGHKHRRPQWDEKELQHLLEQAKRLRATQLFWNTAEVEDK